MLPSWLSKPRGALDELTGGKDLAILDTLAVALYRTGDAAEAVKIEEKAIKQIEAETKNASAPGPLHKMYSARLELFRKAAAEKAENP